MRWTVRPRTWVIGTALIVVLGIVGSYALQAVSGDSRPRQERAAAEASPTARPSEKALGNPAKAKQRAAKAPARKRPARVPAAKPAFPGPLTLAAKRKRAAPSKTVSVTVSSFNVLGSSHTRGRGGRAAGPRRAVGAAQLIAGHGVDIVGLQELQWNQAGVLTSRLRNYGIYPGRSMTAREAENSIMWRADLFELVEARTVTIPYFRGRGRQMPYIKLRSRANGAELWAMNFHNPASLAWAGNNARWRAEAVRREIALVRSLRSAEPDVPVVMTGDMNDRAAFFCPAVGSGLLRASAGGSAGSGGCSLPRPAQIDWVLGTPDLTWSGHVADRSPLVRWTTDHPMVRATTTLTGSNDAVSEAADALAALGG